jgi:hypothetical protein
MTPAPTPELTSEQSQQLQLHKHFHEKILRNAICTPDCTVLESKHRHDYRTHRDEVSGQTYMVDGGLDYLKRSVNSVPADDWSVTSKDDFEVVREVFTWGSYGKDGKQPRTEVKLKDMTIEHIQAILRTQQHIKGSVVEQLFKQELLYRSFQQGQYNVL